MGMASESTTVRERVAVTKGATRPDALKCRDRTQKVQDGARGVGHHGEAASGYLVGRAVVVKGAEEVGLRWDAVKAIVGVGLRV